MKHVISKVCAFLMSLTLLVGLMPAIDAEAYDPDADLGTVTISGVTANDKMKGYKIIDISYNSNNTVSYSWKNDDIANAIKEANNDVELSVEEFGAITDLEERQKLLTGIPAILSGTADLAEVQAVNNTIQIQWTNVQLGGYLIVPTSSSDVYQMMLAIVQPILNDAGEYVTGDAQIAAKNTQVGIQKTADDVTTGDSKVITYTILADVPTYEDGAIDTTYIIGDKLSEGLTYVEDSLKVYGYTTSRDVVDPDNDGKALVGDAIEFGGLTSPNDAYTGLYIGQPGGTISGVSDPTFTITFNYNDNVDGKKNVKGLGIKTIRIEYKVQVNANAVLGSAGNNNTATMEYTHYPFQSNNHKTVADNETVYTYKLNINKYDQATESLANKTMLAGATFKVYLEVGANDTTIDSERYPTSAYVTNATESQLPKDKNYILVSTVTTGDGGLATLVNLDAGKYYIVETVAPNGYTLSGTATSIEITGVTTDAAYDSTNDLYKVEIPNSKGFTLPQTGGSGTVVFTIVGISLMLAAVVVFFVLRRKETHKK